MTLGATRQRLSDMAANVRRYGPERGTVHPCFRAGLTFSAWFWGRTREPLDSTCWEWQGQRNPRYGYGVARYPGGDTVGAHRVAWELAHGGIPPGLHVLHRCDNPPCVRPSHLFLGTHADNAADRERKGRGRSGKVTGLKEGGLHA